jgi:hypothetical protein
MRALLVALCLLAGPVSADAPAPASAAVGWWRSDALCLQLFANGDFELSIMKPGYPKVQVLGSATVHGDAVTLNVKRIWQGRWTSACRKVVKSGQWIDSTEALGVTFAPKKQATLKLQRVDDGHVELCATDCVALHADTPVLVGRWRRADMEYPDQPKRPWRAGDLLELGLDEHPDLYESHLWVGKAGTKFDEIQATGDVKYVSPDRFAITIGKRALTARRLPDERLEVCDAPNHCGTLERQFDPDHYDLN